MTYATLMVHLQVGQSNAGLLSAAADLAQRFRAMVIGVAACQPIQIAYGDGYIPGEVVAQDREEIESEITAAEAEFRAALHDRASSLEFRSAITVGLLADHLAREARSADIIITGVDRNASLFDTSRHLDVSDLVMQVGRPVLIVPVAIDHLRLEHVMVGWKDTGETRRVIADALPLLKNAARVTIVQVVADDDLPAARLDLQDVVGWLSRHGVDAKSIATASSGNDTERLNALAQDQAADLIVAGAYGHSRVREWVLGGVTRDLLRHAERCALVSH